MDVLVRDLSDELHGELTRRAAEAGGILRAYLHQVLAEHVARPSIGPWLHRLDALGPTRAPGPTGAELVAAARTVDDELIGR